MVTLWPVGCYLILLCKVSFHLPTLFTRISDFGFVVIFLGVIVTAFLGPRKRYSCLFILTGLHDFTKLSVLVMHLDSCCMSDYHYFVMPVL